jgi:hypothetical protein
MNIGIFWEITPCSLQERITSIFRVENQQKKTVCSRWLGNYHGILLLSTPYKIVSNILLSRLSPYTVEISSGHQCGFQCNR